MKNDYKITREEHHWTSDEKIKWLGYGEWVEEADILVLEYLGFEASIQRFVKREPLGGYIPTMELMKKQRQAAGEFEPLPIPKGFEHMILFNPVYRNMQYCITVCMSPLPILSVR